MENYKEASAYSLVTAGSDTSAVLSLQKQASIKTVLDFFFFTMECISWWTETRVFKKSVHLGTVSPKTSSVLALHDAVRGSSRCKGFSECFWSVFPISSKLMLPPKKPALHSWIPGTLFKILVLQQAIFS